MPSFFANSTLSAGEVDRKLGTTNQESRKWNIPSLRLPDGRLQIPYLIQATSALTQETIDTIHLALSTIETSSGVLSFTPRTTESSYIYFTHTTVNTCAANIGRISSRPTYIYLGWCRYNQHLGSIIHEILHTLGFWHEQSRPDRDEYVRIVPENIQDGALNNFGKMTDVVDSLGSPYDFGSLMHYPSWAFTKNGQSTIIPLHPLEDGQVMGQRSVLSPHDIQQLRLLHQCSTGVRHVNSITIDSLCSNQCKCWEYAVGSCHGNDNECIGDLVCDTTPPEIIASANGEDMPDTMCLPPGLTDRPTGSPSVSIIPSEMPSESVVPTTSKPPTEHPTSKPTPEINSKWYIDWSISKCAMNCIGHPPCGGLRQYVLFHDTMEACCDAHLYWLQTYDGCSTLPEGTESPTQKPTKQPTVSPTTSSPSSSPTREPTNEPTTKAPSASPTTSSPSKSPTQRPTDEPTKTPSSAPSVSPTTSSPTSSPSQTPTNEPSTSPSKAPSASPTTASPSFSPSASPTHQPTSSPSKAPSVSPTTASPSSSPSDMPTGKPTTSSPTGHPSSSPTPAPVATLWYVDWSKEGGKCVRDCNGARPCGGRKQNWQAGHLSVDACCSTMSWKKFEDCSFEDQPVVTTTTSTIDTGVTTATTSTTADTRWYPSRAKCNNDGQAPFWQHNKYSDQSTCCNAHFSWDYNNCMGILPTASYKWFIDWGVGRCVKECDKSEGGACRGFSPGAWVPLHDTPEICCRAHLSYKTLEECEYSG